MRPRALTEGPQTVKHPCFQRFFAMHAYRTHTCGELRREHVGQSVRLSGWVNRRRDHGGLLFIDLRDHYGLTQCVIEPDAAAFATVDQARSEWVLTFTGKVVARIEGTANP